MSSTSDLARRCADLEELLARERAARKLAQEEARANAAALRVLAREVRAPLDAALEWSQMLRRELLSASGREHALRVVERQISGSVHLIDDLVAAAATTVPRPARIQLDEAVLAAHVAAAPRFNARKLSSVLDLAPTQIDADPGRTERLRRRFLETATDFASEGTELRLALDEHSLACTFDAPSDMPDLPPATWDHVGTPEGFPQPLLVGLFLLRRLAEAQGASLELQRDDGRACFTLTVPSTVTRSVAPTSAFPDHALRSPLQVLAIGVELLRTRVRDSADDIPRDWVLERLDALEQAVDHLSAAVERLSVSERQPPAQSPSAAPLP